MLYVIRYTLYYNLDNGKCLPDVLDLDDNWNYKFDWMDNVKYIKISTAVLMNVSDYNEIDNRIL